MKDAVRELLKDRRSLREAAIVAVLFPLVTFGMNLFGWGNGMFSWWQTLLVAPIMGFVYWLFVSGFRRFVNEDLTPSWI
ncbi:hypothetical protein [Brevibacterium aurantiacum]|uniref:Uncharacterized protein n=1 Tax=Brevibacterium aurantiacum TaxID=273384 RepID=A0A556CD91_BREAU|nr:hypothetical protein [Brevibacterium aurantiacum]TSI15393.1 hypothetical protein FO013_11500 [Brevibacterium aurantiacum]